MEIVKKNEAAYFALVAFLLSKAVFNVFIDDFYHWIAIDYLWRIVVLFFIAVFIHKEWTSKSALLLNFERKDLILACTIFFAAAAFLTFALVVTLFDYIPSYTFGGTPHVKDDILFFIDNYIGMLLIAVTDEIVFRGMGYSALKEKGCGKITTVIYSSLIYALSAVTLSTNAMIGSFCFGAVLMAATIFSRSVIPAIAIHFLISFSFYDIFIY